MAHSLSILFFFGLLVALAVVLQTTIQPQWGKIKAALKNNSSNAA